MAEWQFLLGDELDDVRGVLRPTQHLARSFPLISRGSLGEPLRVVEHGPNDFVGVNDATNEVRPLSKDDLIVYALDGRGLSEKLALALGFDASERIATQDEVPYYLGPIRRDERSFSVFFAIPSETADVADMVGNLAILGQLPFLLLVPTGRSVSAEIELRLRSVHSAVLSLAPTPLVQSDGSWRIEDEILRAVLPCDLAKKEEDPLGQRAREVLVAMLQLKAISADTRRSTADIASRALGQEADANALKPVISELSTRKLIQTREGRGGGCWLTESGRRRAESLRDSK